MRRSLFRHRTPGPIPPAAGLLLVWGLLAGPGAAGAPAAAQSVFSKEGLGYPLDPLDARSRALGAGGPGLRGIVFGPLDPAGPSALYFPAMELSLQPQWASVQGGGAGGGRPRGTRFPLLALAYPVSRLEGTVSVSFGSFFDQRWETRRRTRVELEGTSYPVSDVFQSDGGVAALRVGWAQRLGDQVGVGVGAGRLTGAVLRSLTRRFDSVPEGAQVVSFRDQGRWMYSGTTLSAGFRWDVVEVLRVGGAFQWFSDLEARPSRDTPGEAVSYPLPWEARVGASAALTPTLDLALGMGYSRWDGEGDGGDAPGPSQGLWSVGAGVEWRGWTGATRAYPLRFGFRRQELPFGPQGSIPVESAWSGGVGLELFRAGEEVLGGVDLSLERGRRRGGGVSENFWRSTLTIRVAGF